MGVSVPFKLTVLFAVAAAMSAIVCCAAVERHDTAVPSTPGTEIKCGCIPCGCQVSPPPPPPPSLPPPKNPWVSYCPPPPPAPYLYVVGTPGDMYPFDPNFWPSSACRHYVTLLPTVMVCGLIALVVFW